MNIQHQLFLVITSDVLTSAIGLEHAPQDFMIVISLLAMKLLLRWMGKPLLGMSDHTRLKINRLRTLISNGIAIRERSRLGSSLRMLSNCRTILF